MATPRREIEWADVFAWMDVNRMGARAAARHFGLPNGTVQAAASHRRRLEAARVDGGARVCPKCGAELQPKAPKTPAGANDGT